MHLSDFDLQQLDKARLSELTVSQKEALLEKALEDLKEARERLQADSRTSSRPPSSDAPWSGVSEEPDAEGGPQNAEEGKGWKLEESEAERGDIPEPEKAPKDEEPKSSSKPGRRPGSPGHSRTQQLEVTETIEHRPVYCALCGEALEGCEFTARTGLYVLNIEPPAEPGLAGIQLRHDKHMYGECVCACGHVTRSEPGRCEAEPMWTGELSEWRLIGPRLASLIVCLVQRMRLSRRKVQEFLRDWLGVELSTAVISQCLIEAGRAVEPLEEPLVEELQQAALAYVDETPWKESGQPLWLWVISTATVCLYAIGYRSKEILINVFGETFAGWLMSDGYHAYRHFSQRLRCWAHLLRKAHGLKASLSGQARDFGQATLDVMNEAMEAIYRAREGPPVDLSAAFQARLAAFRALCEQHHDASHEKTRALAREFLNDWEAIWRVLAHPHLPLTNNEAERLLRHWVILRRISQGTHTEQGSRALALLASVIETCRKRDVLPWPYLASVIAERRKGNPAPPLPAAPMA
ncbi:MAG TPA: IS66 family transposase [Acidobacteriota bacterium]|nr:IS66 family transposase [Acidobacteriota bacterium]